MKKHQSKQKRSDGDNMNNNIIKMFREYSGDSSQPYFFSDNDIENSLKNALKQYSAQYPILKNGVIDVFPGKQIYQLPHDYQMWYKGLEEYDVIKNNMIESSACKSIAFVYYADRCIDEIPENNIYFFLSYCYGDLLEKKVLEMTEQNIANGDLKTMKLGRGLELTFEDNKNDKEMLIDLAKEKKQPFFHLLNKNAIGGWC